MERFRLLPSASWPSHHKSWLDKLSYIICNTLEHSCIMQNASYFVSNCVSIGHNTGGLLLFFMVLDSENRVWSVAGSLRPHTFLPLKTGIKNVYNLHGTSCCAKQCHSLKTSVILWPTMAFFLSTSWRLFSAWLRSNCFNPGWVNTTQFNFTVLHSSYRISKQECRAQCLSAKSLPSLHWVNPTSLLPYEVWLGAASSSGFLVVLTELTWFGC